jgi:hypothetical protein
MTLATFYPISNDLGAGIAAVANLRYIAVNPRGIGQVPTRRFSAPIQ